MKKESLNEKRQRKIKVERTKGEKFNCKMSEVNWEGNEFEDRRTERKAKGMKISVKR